MSRLKEVLAVVNNKGGVGKTTTVQSLAAAIVRQHPNYKVLVIDLDPQMHLSILHGWNPSDDFFTTPTVYTAMRQSSSIPVYRTMRDRVFLAPGDHTLQDVDSDLFRQMNPKRVLQKCFGLPIDNHTDRLCPTEQPVQPSFSSWSPCEPEELTTIIDSFDYVFIDCQPALSQSTFNAMTVATGLLVPVQMEGLSVNGLGNIIVAMRDVQSELNPNLELRGLLPTMVDARPKIVRDFIDYLRRSYGNHVTTTMIRRSVKINEAQTMKRDIYDYKPYSPAALNYDMLAHELFDQLKTTHL